MKVTKEIIEIGNWIRAELEASEQQDAQGRIDAVKRIKFVLDSLDLEHE